MDTGLLEEANTIIKELNKALDRFELTELLSGPYDKEGAVIYITAGAGGTDAQVFSNSLSKAGMTFFNKMVKKPNVWGNLVTLYLKHSSAVSKKFNYLARCSNTGQN